ncbi:MAG TPA: GNAT family N-acetyltransferase [Thermoleophilaceae bacterium]
MASPQTARQLVDPGAMLGIVHELDSGLRLGVRLARASDAPRVRAFLERLSPETLHRRFFTSVPEVQDRLVEHFTFYDPRERLVLAATAPVEGVEEIVGLADIALLETGLAELGLVVDDEHQRQGVGTLLAEAIASLAIQRGATRLKAEMLDGNRGMLQVMEQLGPTMQTVERGNRVVYTRLPE